VKKYVKILIGCFVGIPIIIFSKILSLFFKFKFCFLCTSRIGHQLINFDVALSYVTNNTFIFFAYEKKVANKFILSFFKKQKNVFFLKVFKYIYFPIYYANPNSDLIIGWKQYQPKFSFHLKFKSKIVFPSYSKKDLDSIFFKYNLKKNFVGLHARNNLYVKKYISDDHNFHDYRNFNFKDYSLTIEYLNKKNNSIIKLGETFLNEDLDSFKNKIFTLLDFDSNEEIDYLINVYSRYNVVSSSGVVAMSQIARKKTVYVNQIPHNLNELSYCSPESVILPKKIFSKEKGRLLNFRELIEIDFSIHSKIDPYEKHHFIVVNNSAQEILDAVIEMEEKLEGYNNKESKKLNDLYWKAITNNNNHKKINFLKNVLRLSLPSKFLISNQNLF
jgi:putative glycosyltransferase (TIGR04372 family)